MFTVYWESIGISLTRNQTYRGLLNRYIPVTRSWIAEKDATRTQIYARAQIYAGLGKGSGEYSVRQQKSTSEIFVRVDDNVEC